MRIQKSLPLRLHPNPAPYYGNIALEYLSNNYKVWLQKNLTAEEADAEAF